MIPQPYDVCPDAPDPDDPDDYGPPRDARQCSHCPHDPEACAYQDEDDCPHWHTAPDITVMVTEEMITAAGLVDATGAELLGHAVRSALENGALDGEEE